MKKIIIALYCLIFFFGTALTVSSASYKDTFFGGGVACGAGNPCPSGFLCDTVSNTCVSQTTDFFSKFGITETGGGTGAARYGPLRFWANAINMLLGLLGIFTVGVIMYGGFKFITAGGEADKAKSASKTILYATLGLVTIALAWVIGYVAINSIAKMLK